MIRHRDIKEYFSKPRNEMTSEDLEKLERLYAEGFSSGVDVDLMQAFTGYMNTPPGADVKPFAAECHRLLGT